MVAALIKFRQGALVGLPGEAQKGVIGSSVSVENGDNTGVVLWTFDLLYAPPGSALVPTTQGPSILDTFSFTPDAPGTYRLRLMVEDLAGNQDIDIRCFAIAFDGEGLIAPPYQGNPLPRPLVGTGAKPNEMAFPGNEYGWDGNDDPNYPLLFQALQKLDEALPKIDGPLWVAKAATIAALPANTLVGNDLIADANGALPNQDGVALAIGDALLVKNEVATNKHGLYRVIDLGSGATPWVLSRDDFAYYAEDFFTGRKCTVSQGDDLSCTHWTLTTLPPIVLNTTAITFANRVSLGNNPAKSGDLRLSADNSIAWRNDAGTADVQGLAKDTFNNLQLGVNNTNLNHINYRVGLNKSHLWYINDVQKFSVETGSCHASDALRIGGTAATSGELRMISRSSIRWRNEANTADITGIQKDVSNNLIFGESTTNLNNIVLNVGSAKLFDFYINTVQQFKIENNNVWVREQLDVESNIRVGASAWANAGDIRLTSSGDIKARNSANTGNIDLIRLSSNIVFIGGNDSTQDGINYNTRSGRAHTFRVANTNQVQIGQTYLSIGLNTATGGYLRLPNNQYINARDAIGNNNIQMIGVASSDKLVIGANEVAQTGVEYLTKSTGKHDFYVGAVCPFQVAETLVAVAVPFRLKSYTVANLPASETGAMAYCTDEVGGAVPVFYDGADWRRIRDRNIVST